MVALPIPLWGMVVSGSKREVRRGAVAGLAGLRPRHRESQLFLLRCEVFGFVTPLGVNCSNHIQNYG